MTHLYDLPEEMLLRIARDVKHRFGIFDLFQLSQTCQWIREICLATKFDKKPLSNLKFLKDRRIEKCKSMREFGEFVMNFIDRRSTSLSMYHDPDSPNLVYITVYIMRRLPHLRRLRLYGCRAPSTAVDLESMPEGLEQLRMVYCKYTDSLPKATFPGRLKRWKLEGARLKSNLRKISVDGRATACGMRRDCPMGIFLRWGPRDRRCEERMVGRGDGQKWTKFRMRCNELYAMNFVA